MKITNNMIQRYDTEGNNGVFIYEINVKKGDEIVNRILQNEELREAIVDYADLWDGGESGIYGSKLKKLLDRLGIKDTPEFYKKENLDKMIDELIDERHKRNAS